MRLASIQDRLRIMGHVACIWYASVTRFGQQNLRPFAGFKMDGPDQFEVKPILDDIDMTLGASDRS